MNLQIFEARGRYVIARYDQRSDNYVGPMNAEGRRLTGCHSVFARYIEDLAGDPNAMSYAHKRSARRALRRIEERD